MMLHFSKTRKIVLSFLVFAFLPFYLFSLDTKFSGSVIGELGTPFPYALGAKDFSTAIIRLDTSLYLYATDSITFYASDSVLADALAYKQDSLDIAIKDGNFGLSLNEAWFDYSSEYWAVRIGRQINAWGTADGIAVTDILCPRDFSSIDSILSTDNRIGIDAARFSVKFDQYAFDFYWIPLVRTNALPTSKNHPLTKDFANDETFAIRLAKSRKIDPSFKNAEYAFKASAYWKNADVSFYSFYGWDRFPAEFTLSLAPKLNTLYFNGVHKRILMFGADTSVPVGDLMLRLESAFFPYNNLISTRFSEAGMYGSENDFTFESVRSKRMSFLAGLDWMPSNWILSAQYYGDVVFGDISEVLRERYIHLATFTVSKTLFGDTLSLSLAGLIQIEKWNNAFTFLALYNATDSFNIYLKTIFLNYAQEVLINDYKNWGSVTFGIRYSF